MGSVVSNFKNLITKARKYDQNPDPTTGLTQRDRDLITKTWALVADKRIVKQNAVEFLIQLFIAHPYLQDRFELFKGKPLPELRTNPQMRAHAMTVFYVLTSYVENLDDAETLVGLVQKVAVSHIKRDITVRDFENLKIVFLTFLKSLLGTQCTAQTEAAWEKLLSAQSAVFQVTANDLGKSENEKRDCGK